MNYKMTFHILGEIALTEAFLLLIPFFMTIGYHEDGTTLAFGVTIATLVALGLPAVIKKPKDTSLSARSGFIICALAWILLSLFGAMPFRISGAIPNYIDALFETISGFSTTGATILTNIEGMAKSLLFWRAFTHWIGGMGVLVFVIAVLPKSNPAIVNLLKAEVPGPQFGKLVSKMKFSARILYAIYIVLTIVETILLVCSPKMDLFDAVIHAFSTAGTGGFSNYTQSIAYFDSIYIETVIAVFMIIFSINFNLFYMILLGHISEALRSEELRVLFIMFFGSTLAIAISLIINNTYSAGDAFRYSAFQTASIISTTGFSTANFSYWPAFCQILLVFLMFIGGSAGSTAGGLKISRVIIMVKTGLNNLRQACFPRKVSTIKLDKRPVSSELTSNISSYFLLYIIVLAVSTLLVSIIDKNTGYEFATHFSSVISCLNNSGPAIEGIGFLGNYSQYSWFSKLILSFDMLAGRLEVIPMLILFYPKAWKSYK